MTISKFILRKNMFILFISTIQPVIVFIESTLHDPIYSFCLSQPNHTFLLNFEPNSTVSASFPPIPTLHVSHSCPANPPSYHTNHTFSHSCPVNPTFTNSCPANSHSSDFPHPITCSSSFHLLQTERIISQSMKLERSCTRWSEGEKCPNTKCTVE